MSSPEQSSSDLEEYSSNSKRRRITSTPEPQATGNVLLENYNIPSPSPSASTVYEFPVSGDCIDRTIEIGSSGEEHSDAESFAGELIFPSDDDDIGDDCSDDAMLFPSDLEEDDTTVTPPTPGVATSSKSNDSETDVQENLADVGHTLVSGCCQQQCLLSLTPKAVLTIRGKLGALKPSEKKQWITDKVFESSKVSTSCRGKLETNFVLSGVNVCTTAWCKVVQVKEKQLSRISSNVAQGFLNVQHGNKGRKRNNTTSDVAKTWMERYFHLVGDKMPHNDQIHLPSWETQKDVFQRYSSDMAEQQLSQEDTVSLSTFYRIWTECFPKVVIPEVSLYLARL